MDPELDLRVLRQLHQLGGKELVSKMVELFTSHADSALRDAFAAAVTGNLDDVRRAAHSLKSSAGNVGASQMQALADEVEQLAEQETGDFRSLLADLENSYLRAKSRLIEQIREG